MKTEATLQYGLPEYTPGPWCAVNDGTEDEPMMSVKTARIAGQKPRHVVAICATGDSPQQMENANARLIAAAPDMLAALIELRDAHWNSMPGRANELVESAINKAKGAKP